jgi:hypothetical protein
MSNAARGTFEALLDRTTPDLAAIGRRLREAIFAVDPAAVETVRLGDNAATYGVGPKKMTEGYAYIMPMRGYVNLGFYQGASLKDARLEGTGKGLRHVKIRSLDEASDRALRGLLAAALAARKRGRDPAEIQLASQTRGGGVSPNKRLPRTARQRRR